MSESEAKRLQREYAEAAKAHNERAMEIVGKQIDAAKSQEKKPDKEKSNGR